MLTRTAEPALIKRLNSGPALLLFGPQQIGKTTLALTP
jgi:predicted AAA+ superfamily ATPase